MTSILFGSWRNDLN